MALKTISFRSIGQVCMRIFVFAAYAVAFSSLLTLCKLFFFLVWIEYNGLLTNANFYPINGKFQAFNPIRRLLAGQSPGLDFVSYTGSGPMFLTLAAMIISDCTNFTCSVFWGNLLSGLSSVLFFSWIAFLCLVGGEVPLARWFRIFLALTLGLMIAVPLATGYPQLDRHLAYISQLNTIGNSQLSLRAANATICSILVFIISLCQSSSKRAAFTVASFCFTLMWSNDYGVFSALSVIATYGLTESRANGLSFATLKRLAIVAAASVATYFVAVTIISSGHPLLWIARNVLGVAQDQMWYFLPHKKVLTLSDIHLALPSTLKVWTSVASFVCIVLWRPRVPALYACTALVFTTLGAGLVSQIGGHISEHYLVAFERAFWPAISVWGVCLAQVALTKFIPPRLFGALFFLIGLFAVVFIEIGDGGSRVRLFERRMSVGIEYGFIPKLPPIYFVFCILLAHYALSTWASRRWANVTTTLFLLGFLIVTRRSDGSNLLTPPALKHQVSIGPSECAGHKQIYVPSLGGCLQHDRAESLDRFAAITNRSPDLFSTYSSAFDVMMGTFNSTPSDYIIHALGDELRARYESTLAEGKHEYVTTIREDFTEWEGWVRRTNWGAYVGIVSRYRPIASTDYSTLWKRSAATEQNLAAGACEIIRQSPTSTLLKVTAPAELRGPGYVDINIDYVLSKGSWWKPPYPIQSYVIVKDGMAPFDGRYGIPSKPGAHSWRFPVQFHEKDFLTGESPHRVVDITILPAGSELTVSKCWSRFSIDASRFSPG